MVWRCYLCPLVSHRKKNTTNLIFDLFVTKEKNKKSRCTETNLGEAGSSFLLTSALFVDKLGQLSNLDIFLGEIVHFFVLSDFFPWEHFKEGTSSDRK